MPKSEHQEPGTTSEAAEPTALAQAHVLLCDDDIELRQLLTDFLSSNGYRVTALPDGREVARRVQAGDVDLLILDLMLPGTDGLTICRELRTVSTVPILMLTAKGSELDRILGLEMGADDYISKPFSPPELLARVKALIRRSRMQGDGTAKPGRVLTFEGWRLDTLRRELRNPGGVIIDLSAGEYDLLATFLEAPQRVLDRDYLLEASRSRTAAGFDRSIDVQVSRLLRKIDAPDAEESFIKTVRGAGYMFLSAVTRS